MHNEFVENKGIYPKNRRRHKFIMVEMKRFKKHLPAFAEVVISERDEYLAQSICELAN